MLSRVSGDGSSEPTIISASCSAVTVEGSSTSPTVLPARIDGDRVGVLEDLVELVGDEDHGRLAGRQLAQRGEQLVDLVGNEHGRGLVEDQDLGTAVEHLEDLDPLLLADTEVGHELVGIDLQPVAAAEGADPAAGGVSGEHRPARLAAEHDVLPHREVVGEHEVLEDHADAVADRRRRGPEVLHLAVDEDRSLVGLMGAVQRLHQRRLAGAVLADDGVDRAAADLEVDAVVGDDAGEALDDVAQLDGVLGAGGRPPVDGLRHDTHVLRRSSRCAAVDPERDEGACSGGAGALGRLVSSSRSLLDVVGTTIVPSTISASRASIVGT